ncbi:MAG: hypothetical protein GX488_06115 [Clostridiales bacterium]|nr:hypothetical protein [Clostridiales bacterium]
MRNILIHVPQKEKDTSAAQLKEIRLAPSADLVCQRSKLLSDQYDKRFSKTIYVLWEELEIL